MHSKARQRGFTLIELIVVITVLSLLMVVVAPQMFERADDAKRKAAQIQIDKVGNTIELYKLEVGRFPQTLEDLVQKPSDTENWKGPYLKKKALLKDPWERDLVYVYPGEHGRFDLLSLGSDGQRGGEGENADITSWE